MNKWKWLAFGIGVVVGSIVTSVVSSRPSIIRNGASTVLSHGLAAKKKLQTLAETGKENLDDLLAEADQKHQNRQAASTPENN